MQHPGFFHRAGPFSLKDIAAASGAIVIGEDSRTIDDVRPLHLASERDVSFFENRKYAMLLGATRAGACILAARDAAKAPQGISILTSDAPYTAFARVLTLFYADALRSKAAATAAESNGALVHASAQIADAATVEPGAVVGREAVIGEGSVISAGAVVAIA